MDIVETNSRLVDSLTGVYDKFNDLPIFGTDHSKVLKEDNARMVKEEKFIWLVSQCIAFFTLNPFGRVIAIALVAY